ncbi:hypothetical protein EB001_19955 [bacterium]|nr:hypothetical protein [bacterium]
MTNINIPAWAGSADTMARRVNPIIHLIAMGKSVSPSTIDDLVRPAGSTKAYSAKYITFLRLLGFDFSVQKDGRKIVSYTCITEPKNAADIRAIGPKTSKAKAAKVAKAAAPKVAKTKAVKAAPSKSVAAIKAKNLEMLKAVGAKQVKAAKRVREFDDVTEQFGNSGEVGTSFNVDRDWDSIDGLDLQKLVG